MLRPAPPRPKLWCEYRPHRHRLICEPRSPSSSRTPTSIVIANPDLHRHREPQSPSSSRTPISIVIANPDWGEATQAPAANERPEFNTDHGTDDMENILQARAVLSEIDHRARAGEIDRPRGTQILARKRSADRRTLYPDISRSLISGTHVIRDLRAFFADSTSHVENRPLTGRLCLGCFTPFWIRNEDEVEGSHVSR